MPRRGRGEDGAQQAVRLCPDGVPARSHLVVPGVDVLVRDPVDPVLAERGIDKPVQQHPILLTGRGAQLAPRVRRVSSHSSA